MPPGWPSSALSGCCAPRSSRPNRFASCATGPGPGPGRAGPDRTREVQRLEKFLESTGIKLSESVHHHLRGLHPGRRCHHRRNRGGHDSLSNPGRLASWAGLSPGSNESAGRVKSTKTHPGNRYLTGALGIAALSKARHPEDSYLGARAKRIIVRCGEIKAIVANEHSILTAVWYLLAEGECYHDPGSDVFTKKAPAGARNNAIHRLQARGYKTSP